jgi:hypothetical protein
MSRKKDKEEHRKKIIRAVIQKKEATYGEIKKQTDMWDSRLSANLKDLLNEQILEKAYSLKKRGMVYRYTGEKTRLDKNILAIMNKRSQILMQESSDYYDYLDKQMRAVCFQILSFIQYRMNEKDTENRDSVLHVIDMTWRSLISDLIEVLEERSKTDPQIAATIQQALNKMIENLAEGKTDERKLLVPMPQVAGSRRKPT